MSNQKTNPNNNTQNRQTLTTQSLGIADTKVKDLVGFILEPRDLNTAVVEMLMQLGIDFKHIRCVKVGCSEPRKSFEMPKLRVIAEIHKNAFEKAEKLHKKEDVLLYDASNYEYDDYKVPRQIFKALHNKAYHKHLQIRKIVRETRLGGSPKKVSKFYQIEFDPEILIAFIYNINFLDSFYKISVQPKKWLDDKALRKKYDSSSKRREQKAIQMDFKKDRLSQCEIFVTYSRKTDLTANSVKSSLTSLVSDAIDKFVSNNQTTSTAISQETGNQLKNYVYNSITKSEDMKSLVDEISGQTVFHPNQVDIYFGDDEVKKHNKKKK